MNEFCSEIRSADNNTESEHLSHARKIIEVVRLILSEESATSMTDIELEQISSLIDLALKEIRLVEQA